MSKAVLKGNDSGTGIVTLETPNTNTDMTIALPARASTLMADGPAFSAYVGTNQSVSSNTNTKIAFNSELFDTANCFDSTTNYRFTPNVAGYYQFNICTYNTVTSGSLSRMLISIQKNGTEVSRPYDGNVGGNVSMGSALIYMNGSTDYVDGWIYLTGTNPAIDGQARYSYFQGYLARGA